MNPVFNFYHICYFSAFSQQYLRYSLCFCLKQVKNNLRSWVLSSSCVQMDRRYDRAMVIVVAGNLKLAVRGSQQLYSSERVAVWCLASWHM